MTTPSRPHSRRGLEREGFDVDRVETGQGGARSRDGVGVRRGAPRPRAARPRRVRRVPRAAGEVGRPDHRGHRPFGGDRPRGRSRAGRRRLHREAVRLPRARGPHPCRRAPASLAAVARGRHRDARPRDRPPDPSGRRRGQRGRARPPRSSTCSRSSPRTRARCAAVSRCSKKSGTRIGTARRRRSTCTSRRCGRSSVTRAGSRPSAVSGSGCGPRATSRGEAATARQLPLDHHVRPGHPRSPVRRVVRELGRAPAHERHPARRVRARDPRAGVDRHRRDQHRVARTISSDSRPATAATPAVGW